MRKTALLGLVAVLATGMTLAVEAKPKEFVGNVVSVSKHSHTVVVENVSGSKKFALETNVKIREEIGDKKIDLDQLRTGDRVKVVYVENGDKLMASKLERMAVTRAASTSHKKKY